MAKLYFYYSTMNAGKSTILLQAAYNYRERGMEPFLITAKLDNRAGYSKIVSRIGIEEKANLFDSQDNLFLMIKKTVEKILTIFGIDFSSIWEPFGKPFGTILGALGLKEELLTLRKGCFSISLERKINKIWPTFDFGWFGGAF